MNRKKRMRLKHTLLLLALMGSGSACLAQQDRLSTAPAQETMDISGHFGLGWLDVAFAAPGATPSVDSVTLRVGGQVTTLPACIVALLPSRRMGQVRAYLAWHHDEPGPSRLGIDFAAAEPPPASGPGKDVTMYFDGKTAKLVDIFTSMHYVNDITIRAISPRLAQRCSRQELDAVLDPMHKSEAL